MQDIPGAQPGNQSRKKGIIHPVILPANPFLTVYTDPALGVPVNEDALVGLRSSGGSDNKLQVVASAFEEKSGMVKGMEIG